MLITHLGKGPKVHSTAYIAPNATICGDVTVGPDCRVLFGACVVAEGSPISLGENGIVMENAVVRSTGSLKTSIGAHCLIGPHAHVVGATLEDCVFVATGACVFHGARLRFGAEVCVQGVVHLRTELPEHATVPIGWVAVGNPARILPPDQHEAIWAIQEPLNFPKFVYGVERPTEGESAMREITRRRSEALAAHRSDTVPDGGSARGASDVPFIPSSGGPRRSS